MSRHRHNRTRQFTIRTQQQSSYDKNYIKKIKCIYTHPAVLELSTTLMMGCVVMQCGGALAKKYYTRRRTSPLVSTACAIAATQTYKVTAFFSNT